MKKKFLALFTFVLMLFIFVPYVPSYADSSNGTPRVTDDADLLSDSEERQLEDKLAKISAKYKCDVIIVTKESIGNADAGEYANNFFVDNGFGMGKTKSGISLVLGMNGEPGNRPFDITAHSNRKGAQKIFSETKRDAIVNSIGNYLSQGNYYDAFNEYANQVENYLKKYQMMRIAAIPISFIVGFIISLLIMSGQKATLKSVHTQPAARSYLVNSNVSGNDMRNGFTNGTNGTAGKVAAGVAAGILLSIATEQFLYSNVSKTPRQTSSSSGGGSISHSSGSGYSSSRGRF